MDVFVILWTQNFTGLFAKTGISSVTQLTTATPTLGQYLLEYTRASYSLQIPIVYLHSLVMYFYHVHQGSDRMVSTGIGKGLKQDLNHL